jgi:hypothetical protein
MNMSNQDLDWLGAQQPQRMGTDHGARERALLALLQHTSSRPGGRGFSFGHVFRTRIFGLGAATGIAAVAAALVLSAGGNTGGGTAGAGRVSRSGRGAQTAVHHHSTVTSPLIRLADDVSGSASPTGNATLVARTTVSGGNSVTVYDLYADAGDYFFSQAESGLQGQVNADDNLAGGLFAREVAAAKLATTGSVQTAAQEMADAADPSHVISPALTPTPADRAAISAKLAAMGQKSTGPGAYDPGTLYDNWVWEDSQDALIAGSGEPAVRAGVLQILATLPGVTVTHGTSAGQPTLVLTAGAYEMGSGYAEQLTINADSGVPIQFLGGPTGAAPAITVNYQVSRVTLDKLPAVAGGGQ